MRLGAPAKRVGVLASRCSWIAKDAPRAHNSPAGYLPGSFGRNDAE